MSKDRQPVVLPRRSAGAVAVAYLRDQVTAMHALEVGVRRDAPDAVHQMRVATRRLRSALATDRPLFHRTRTDPIRDELQWLGQVLGGARDAEVLRERLDALVLAQPAELVIGPVRERIRTEMRDRHRLAHEDVVHALGSTRFRHLLADLNRLVDDPPLRTRSRRRADAVIPGLVGRSAERVDRAAAAAVDAADTDRPACLHEVRKAAKRARYAAEAARPVGGKVAKRLARRMADLQDVLGEHQDSVEARRVLREIAIVAHRAGEDGFTLGVLHGAEQARADAAVHRYPAALAATAKPKVRRWTSA